MISVRRLRKGEGELFRHMRLAALRESPHAFGSTYESALERTPESWHEQAEGTAEGPDRATFIAFSGDELVGIAALYRDSDDSDTGEVLQVWVAPESRGKSVADALMDALFDWAGENGFRRVLATITAGNARALAFYRKYGFEDSDETPRCGPDDPVLVKVVETALLSSCNVDGIACPRCASEDTAAVTMSIRNLVKWRILTWNPRLPLFPRRRRCNKCGHEW